MRVNTVVVNDLSLLKFKSGRGSYLNKSVDQRPPSPFRDFVRKRLVGVDAKKLNLENMFSLR